MGFYGQVVYEFTKLFSKFLITQSDNADTPVNPPAVSQDIFLEADNMWEQINIKPVNRWIQLNGTGTNASTKTIEIGHSTPGSAVDEKETISVEKCEANTSATQLQMGDCLKIATTEYDKAGHLVGEPASHYYNLPTITINANNKVDTGTNDNFYIKGDSHWITADINDNAAQGRKEIVFSHSTPQVGTAGVQIDPIDTFTKVDTYAGTPIQLSYGDLITTGVIKKDDNGHIVGYDSTCYKLPISQSEEDFTALQNEVDALEDRLASGTITNVYGDKENYGSYEEIVDKVYKTGDIHDLFYDRIAAHDLVGAIGKLNGDNGYSKHIAALSGSSDTNKALYTISEAITKLCEAIDSDREDFKGLQARVTALEAAT